MRTFLTFFLSFTLLYSGAVSIAAADSKRDLIPQKTNKKPIEEKHAFARSFAEQVLSIIQDATHKMEDRKDILRNAFRNSVDIQWIAKFVLGSNIRQLDEKKKEEYITTYRRYLTETYVSNFAEDPEKRIRDIKIRKVYDSSDEDFTVRTNMLLANGEELAVSYLVNEDGDHYLIRDFAIENVSLITTHRNELSKLAQEKGVDQLIKELNTRIRKMQRKQADYSIR